MADSGRWWKLWCSSITDPELGNLDISDFGRWTKLGAFTKAHGTDGRLVLSAPANLLCSLLQLPAFDDIISCARRLPNLTVSSVTNPPVSFTIEFRNWLKYQGDFSTPRVKKFRAKNAEMKRSKRRRDERRGEETQSPSGLSSPSETQSTPGIPPIVPRGGAPLNSDFETFWQAWPSGHREGRGKAEEAYRKHVVAARLPVSVLIEAIAKQKQSRKWNDEAGRFIPMPATWLNQHRWADDLQPNVPLTPKTAGNLAAAERVLARLKQEEERSGKA